MKSIYHFTSTTILTSNNYSTLYNQEPDQKQFIDFSSWLSRIEERPD